MTATLFLRTNLHPNSVGDGQVYFGVIFFSLIMVLFDGFAEETLTVRLAIFLSDMQIRLSFLSLHRAPIRSTRHHRHCRASKPFARCPCRRCDNTETNMDSSDPSLTLKEPAPHRADALQVQRLPGWFKQRDNYFYPAWAYVYPTTVLRMPYSLLVAVLWSCIVYYPVGLAPEASRCATDQLSPVRPIVRLLGWITLWSM